MPNTQRFCLHYSQLNATHIHFALLEDFFFCATLTSVVINLLTLLKHFRSFSHFHEIHFVVGLLQRFTAFHSFLTFFAFVSPATLQIKYECCGKVNLYVLLLCACYIYCMLYMSDTHAYIVCAPMSLRF